MNIFIITAGLTADPDLRYLQSGKAVAKIRVAVKRDYKNKQGEYESDFFNLSCFDKTAEFAAEYLRKGSKALFTCNIKNANYEKDGVKIYKDEIYIEKIEFIGNKKKEENKDKEKDFMDNFNDIGEIEEDNPF